MAVGSCLSDSPSTSFGALAGKGSRGRLWDWGSPSPGHPVLQSVDILREWHRICEGKRSKNVKSHCLWTKDISTTITASANDQQPNIDLNLLSFSTLIELKFVGL